MTKPFYPYEEKLIAWAINRYTQALRIWAKPGAFTRVSNDYIDAYFWA